MEEGQTAYLTRGTPPHDFIQIEQNGLTLTKRVGQIGHRGRMQSKEAADVADAQRVLRRWFQTAAKNGYTWASASAQCAPPSTVNPMSLYPEPPHTWLPPRAEKQQQQQQQPRLYERHRSHSSQHRAPSTARARSKSRSRSRQRSPSTTSIRAYQRHCARTAQATRDQEVATAACSSEAVMDELATSRSSSRRYVRTIPLSASTIDIFAPAPSQDRRKRRRNSHPHSPVRYVRRPSRFSHIV